MHKNMVESRYHAIRFLSIFGQHDASNSYMGRCVTEISIDMETDEYQHGDVLITQSLMLHGMLRRWSPEDYNYNIAAP